MRKPTVRHLPLLFACAAIISGSAEASGRPAPEDFASYSQYLVALFDYQKQQAAKPRPSSPPPVADATPPRDDFSTRPRSTFKSFTLPQIATYDLGETGIDNALGIFSDHAPVARPGTTARLRDDNSLALLPDTDLSLRTELSGIQLANVQQDYIESGTIYLSDGSGTVHATSRVVGDSVNINLSSKVRTGIIMFDEDGLPRSGYAGDAGAVVVSSIGIEVTNLDINIHSLRSSSNTALIGIDTRTDKPIVVDLSGTKIGVANAPAKADRVGLRASQLSAYNFMSLGDNTQLVIAPGAEIKTTISRPRGMITPLATLDGYISEISMNDLDLMNQEGAYSSKSTVRIKRLQTGNIDLEGTKVFIDNASIVLELGSKMNNLWMNITGLTLGSSAAAAPLGDIEMRPINAANSRIRISAH
ncbi:MAG TPA: hypothetical protein VF050_05785 [Moraxellaceae bacterium]